VVEIDVRGRDLFKVCVRKISLGEIYLGKECVYYSFFSFVFPFFLSFLLVHVERCVSWEVCESVRAFRGRVREQLLRVHGAEGLCRDALQLE
jgi:hypothetical protein